MKFKDLDYVQQKYRYCCKCEDNYLSDTYVCIRGYGRVHVQLKDDGVIDYTCWHCNIRNKFNHNRFEPVSIKTHYECEHIKGQIEKKERIKINMFKIVDKNTRKTYAYLLRCEECCSKAAMEDDDYIDACVQDQVEDQCYVYDRYYCKDDENKA